MALLAIPAFSAWTWHKEESSVPVEPASPVITQRLPVEIITAERDPKWVLLPIDPG